MLNQMAEQRAVHEKDTGMNQGFKAQELGRHITERKATYFKEYKT